jgi:hypothetical protein
VIVVLLGLVLMLATIFTIVIMNLRAWHNVPVQISTKSLVAVIPVLISANALPGFDGKINLEMNLGWVTIKDSPIAISSGNQYLYVVAWCAVTLLLVICLNRLPVHPAKADPPSTLR